MFKVVGDKVHHNNIYMGQFINIKGYPKTFSQYSGHDNQIFDIELSKMFMKTQTKNELKVRRGWATKNQSWFEIKEVV